MCNIAVKTVLALNINISVDSWSLTIESPIKTVWSAMSKYHTSKAYGMSKGSQNFHGF